MMVGLIVGGVVLLLVILMFNMLVSRKNQVENAFGSVDVMLKKRFDLIPNLVSTVKAYMQHEQATLTKLTELRAKAVSNDISSDEKVDLSNQISNAVRGIMVSVENYPDLKASDNFMQLQGTWNETEEQISASRRFFNSAVTDYNNAVEQFPTNMFAGIMGYKRKAVFEIPEVERQNISAQALFQA